MDEILRELERRVPRGSKSALDEDEDVLEILREVGRRIVKRRVDEDGKQAIAAARAEGRRVHAHHEIVVRHVFGECRVVSPYMWSRAKGGERPVSQRLGLCDGSSSRLLQKVLTSFGAEESFGRAADLFSEHYGWSLHRTTVRRTTESWGKRAQSYVEQRLAKEALQYESSLSTRPGVEQLIAEVDGSMVRTGTLHLSGEPGSTPKRHAPKKQRAEEWREVRVGLVRAPAEVEKTYVAQMGSYEDVCTQLFGAAVGRGLASETKVHAVADGGNGLREALEMSLPNVRFTLDRAHLSAHFYEAADALGLKEIERWQWAERHLARIDIGDVDDVLKELEAHRGRGRTRVRRLVGYRGRFRDAVDYMAARAAGLPIGSGEVESAQKTIPQKRMKLPGACWHPKNINPMLSLRVIRANGWWSDFWSAHARQPAVQ